MPRKCNQEYYVGLLTATQYVHVYYVASASDTPRKSHNKILV